MVAIRNQPVQVSAVDEAPRKAARVAGIVYLISFALIAYVNFGIHESLYSGDPILGHLNADETARNIVAHQTWFRLGIALTLLWCLGVMVVLAAFYVILRPFGRTMALVAAASRVLLGGSWAVGAAALFNTLRLLSGDPDLRVFTPEQLRALASLPPSVFWDYYYIGLLFWSLSAMLFSYLWLRSRHIPRAFAAFGMAAGALATLPVFFFILYPDFSGIESVLLLDSPLAIFELSLSVVLVVRPPRPAPTGDGVD